VAVADRTEENAAGTVALINAAGGQAIAIGGDVSVEADVAAMVARTVAAYGRIDCAFNNAGVAEDPLARDASVCTNSARPRSTRCWPSISGACSCA